MARTSKSKGDTLATCEPGDVVRLSLGGEEALVRLGMRLCGGGFLGRTVDVLDSRICDTSDVFVVHDDTPFHGRELGREWYAARNSADGKGDGKKTTLPRIFR